MNNPEVATAHLPVFESLVYERLRPTTTPEMGFQSYELLDGDGKTRKAQQEAFLRGEIKNPKLDYPLFDEMKMRTGMAVLEVVADQADFIPDRVAAAAVRSSAEYHMAEMAWLIEAQRMNGAAQEEDSQASFEDHAQRYQEANEQLYGKIDEAVAGQVYGEIFAQARAKKLDQRASDILNELENGAVITVAGEHIKLPALGEKTKDRLPTIDKDTLKDLGEVLREDCAPVFDLTEKYWKEVLVPRYEGTDKEPGYTVEDMKIIFESVRDLIDPENVANIQVKIVPGKSALSWDTPTFTVQIGESRARITNPKDMTAKIIHELYIHGGRAVNGIKSKLPVLGTGLYTQANLDKGERADYLTFEEGFATIAEMAVLGEEQSWTPTYVSRYLACMSFYEGMDFRQAYEVNWRARVLMAVKDGQPLTDAVIEKEKKQAYLSAVRIARGTPTDKEKDVVLTFNKDLAYLEGKLAASKYLRDINGDKAKIRRLFTAKFDPTNAVQDDLVSRYGIKPE